jgi:hypothetical protein
MRTTNLPFVIAARPVSPARRVLRRPQETKRPEALCCPEERESRHPPGSRATARAESTLTPSIRTTPTPHTDCATGANVEGVSSTSQAVRRNVAANETPGPKQ